MVMLHADLPASAPAESPAYGRAYQLQQLEKYRQRAVNHWSTRIALAQDLVSTYALPRMGKTPHNKVQVVDIGCSIGTFAIEFSKAGFDAVGVDLDAESLELARQLAQEEGVSPRFVHSDLGAWDGGGRPIDIAIAFDIFEHLHDDQIGALLATIRRRLSSNGTLVFHTFPTEFDFLFFENEGRLADPLVPFARRPPREFERRTRVLAMQLDAGAVEKGGLPRRDAIRLEQHCNPLGERRLRFMLERAGFEVSMIRTAQLYPYGKDLADRFKGQPIVDRNLFGAAIPRGV